MTVQVPPSHLMTPTEVSRLFSVDPKTVTRWAAAGKLSFTRGLGGQRRYYRHEVLDLLLSLTEARSGNNE